MLRIFAMPLFAAFALAACQHTAADIHRNHAEKAAPKETPERADGSELVNARGFMAANPVAPTSAKKRSPDGRPRDSDGRPYGYDLLGEALPELRGELSSGAMFDSTALTRWTVIRVWGVWCHDSRNDAPYAAALDTALAQDPGVDFITLHVPQDDQHLASDQMFKRYGSLERYLKSENLSFPTLTDTDASLRKALKIEWTPSYLVVSPDGIIRGFRTDLSVAGDQPVKDFVREISRLRGEIGNAPRVESLLQIGPDGAAYLSGPTAFSLAAMRAAFPGLDSITLPDPSFSISHAAHGTLFTVWPDWTLGQVASVSTTNSAVLGPLKERIGAYTFADLPEAYRTHCALETGTGPARLVCADPGSDGRFSRVFAQEKDHPLVEMRYAPPPPK